MRPRRRQDFWRRPATGAVICKQVLSYLEIEMEGAPQKIGVIGVGAVGSATVLSAVFHGDAREIVVVNRDRRRE